ncbi:phospholipase D family protein [Oxalobacteraceae sp. CFBP 8753]|nr:phospholipase D family protein [Oxalobacteraceae sp. CFBP 8753]
MRQMSFANAKRVNVHYGLAPRKSQEQLAGQIVLEVGTGLDVLVSDSGPFSLSQWNKIAEELGGSPRNSYASVGNEIAVSLDPVYDAFDGSMTISDLRKSKSDCRILATKLGIPRLVLENSLANTYGNKHLSTFVTEYRQSAIAAAKPLRHQAAMSVSSSRVQAAAIDRMSIPWMARQVQGAEVVRIAAGFYDVDFLESILKSCVAHTVCLIFNGLGGQRLHAQRAELADLCEKLTRADRTVTARLSFAPGMFHSKLFLMTQKGKVTALVGSANATSAAFMRNEEILISLADAGALDGYFDAAWRDARSLHSLVQPATSLISFFRTGVLYFKPTATLTTTIHPFLDLLKLMTSEERALLGGVALPFSEQIAGIGPFSLKQALQKVVDTEDWEASDPGKESGIISNQLSIKRWSVETCFGYWVPSRLDERWQIALNNAGAVKREKIESFAYELRKVDKETLNGKYQKYLSEVEKVLEERIVRLPALRNMLERDPFDIAFFEKFVTRVIGYLDDPRRIRRLAEPFISGAMPEFWDDEDAYQDFRASFFDYLDQVVRSNRSKAKVAQVILKRLKVVEPVGSEDGWTSLFEDALQVDYWEEDEWIVGFDQP